MDLEDLWSPVNVACTECVVGFLKPCVVKAVSPGGKYFACTLNSKACSLVASVGSHGRVGCEYPEEPNHRGGDVGLEGHGGEYVLTADCQRTKTLLNRSSSQESVTGLVSCICLPGLLVMSRSGHGFVGRCNARCLQARRLLRSSARSFASAIAQ